jgi:hypothetical protein
MAKSRKGKRQIIKKILLRKNEIKYERNIA